jgi:hypothetical protein
LEALLEGVSEYGLMLRMVREYKGERTEYTRFYPWAQVRSVGLVDPQAGPS